MELLREEYLSTQDDNLGENTAITPLRDAVAIGEFNTFKIEPDEEDFDDEDELEEEEALDVDDDMANFSPLSQIDPDDEDDLDEEDDLLDDDDDLDADITPDLDDDDLLAEDDDDLLADEDDDFEDDAVASTSTATQSSFSNNTHGRTTGTMLDHEPGLPG